VRSDAARQLNAILGQQIWLAGGMDAEHEHHRRILHALKGDVVTCPDFQNYLQFIFGAQQSFRHAFVPKSPAVAASTALQSGGRGPIRASVPGFKYQSEHKRFSDVPGISNQRAFIAVARIFEPLFETKLLHCLGASASAGVFFAKPREKVSPRNNSLLH